MCGVIGFGVAGLRMLSSEILISKGAGLDGKGAQIYTLKVSILCTQFHLCKGRLTCKHSRLRHMHKHTPKSYL